MTTSPAIDKTAWIDTCSEPEKLRTIMTRTKGTAPDVYRKAFNRLCQIEGREHDDPLDREFYAMLTAYEELLSEKHGRKQPAGRTRQKLSRRGVVQCLEDWAVASKTTQGFESLVTNGLAHLTGEYIVLRYAARFSAKAVANSGRRLMELGVELPKPAR